MRKLISYPIDRNAPGWPGNPTYEAENYSSIARGDSAYTYILHLYNHFGTHMDAPKHFNDKGARLHTFPIDTFIYEKPLLLDIPKRAGEKIQAADPGLYSENGPAVSSEAAKYLVEHYAGQLKALALDFVSLASASDTTDGDEAHRWMCGYYTHNHIFIIEDVKMSEISAENLRRAAAIPLYLLEVDSSPVTMWVEET